MIKRQQVRFLRMGGARLIRLKYISFAVTQPAHQTLMDSYIFVTPEQSPTDLGFHSLQRYSNDENNPFKTCSVQ